MNRPPTVNLPRTAPPSPALRQRLLRRYGAAAHPVGRLWLGLEAHWHRWLWRWRLQGPALIKRSVDVSASFVGLLLLSPLLFVIALAIVLEDGGPVLFRQLRVGQFGKEFSMYKFRSMCVDAEARWAALVAQNRHGNDGITFKLARDPRVTRVGRLLRKFSLDELPQLYNVLIGDMSLVGPRPPLPREVRRYTLADRRRLAARPGITCLWQIGGRSEIDFNGQVRLDVEYIEKQSLGIDFKILLRTVPAVLSGKGAC